MECADLSVRGSGLAYVMRSYPAQLALLAQLAGVAACSSDEVAALRRGVEIARDGDRTITSAGTLVNRYARLGADARPGDTQLSMGPTDLTALGVGIDDLVMVMQAQGAALGVPADPLDPTYGEVRDLGGAGLFELIRVVGVDPAGKVLLDETCGGLRNAYSVAGKAQVIRVPQFRTLRVNAGSSIAAAPWNGVTGGVVALRARFSVTLAGGLDVSGAGSRGGIPDRVSGVAAADQPAYYGAASASGGEKGEGVGGFGADYDAVGGRHGRGAPANGGGGGNSHRSGGGGGGGAGAAAGWTGQGVMSGAVAGAAQAWPLDPGYQANGGKLTTSPGGGRGGYSASTTSLSPLTVPPGDPSWQGNLRRERGQLVGDLANEPAGLSGRHLGSRVVVDDAQVSDWAIITNEGMYGSFTTRVMLPFIDPNEAASLRQMLTPQPLPAGWSH